ncbi:MAG: hypothetical protein JRN43_07160, partial [Nitrososphaerota archaeon]|nr:hypothetical protein [Nitrososphaerota archaeon]
MSLASLGLRNSFRKPLRTSLSVAGIALCIVLVLTVTAVSARYTTVVDQSYTIYNADLIVVSKGALLLGGLPLGAVISQGAVSEVASVKGVTSATPILIVVDVNGLVPSNITIGIPIQNFSMFASATPLTLEGSYPESADQVVVGDYLASTGGLRVGSTIHEAGAALTVSGVVYTSNIVLGNAVIMPLQTAQASLGYSDLVSAVLVDTDNATAGVPASIESAVPGVGVLSYGASQAITAPLLSSVGTFDIAMAAVAYTSTRSRRRLYLGEVQRELREMKEVPHLERQEVRDVLVKWGYKGADLEDLLDAVDHVEVPGRRVEGREGSDGEGRVEGVDPD